MSRIPLLFLAGLVATSGAASACSLAYEPFADPTWDGMLRYVDGSELRAKDGGADLVLESGFFLTYAVDGDTLVVSGQKGLDADCTGEGWLRIVEDDRVVHAESGMHKVFDHADGAIVVQDGEARLLPWDGGDERRLARLPDDVWVRAWSPALHPAYMDGDTVHAGGRSFDVPAGARVEMAAGPGRTGVLVMDGERATLYDVHDDAAAPVFERSWTVGEAWQGDLAWAGHWYAVVEGKLYALDEVVQHVDIGAEVVSVGARGDAAVAFHQDGYVLLDGTEAVSAAERQDGAWRPVSAHASTRAVDSSSHPDASGWTESRGGGEEGVETLPLPGIGLVLVALLVALRRR